MSRFLSTVPTNHGFVNLGLIESYPTGGTGPVAFGPTSYFGSDPRPPELGDNLNNPIDIGNFNPLFSSQTISGTHGGLTRRQSTFYKFVLNTARSIQVTQNFSTTAYTRQTNRNTLIAFYKLEEANFRKELPINDEGYVFHDSAIDYAEDDTGVLLDDYPSTSLKKGKYLFVITNDIRYLETTYSIGLNVSVLDWRFVRESPTEQINFGLITTAVTDTVNFGNL